MSLMTMITCSHGTKIKHQYPIVNTSIINIQSINTRVFEDRSFGLLGLGQLCVVLQEAGFSQGNSHVHCDSCAMVGNGFLF